MNPSTVHSGYTFLNKLPRGKISFGMEVYALLILVALSWHDSANVYSYAIELLYLIMLHCPCSYTYVVDSALMISGSTQRKSSKMLT